MNKRFKILFVLLSIFLLVGCSSENNEEKKEKNETKDDSIIKCSISKMEVEDYSISSSYEIHSTDGVVDKVTTIETVETDDESILSTFEEQLETTYETANETYGGYTYKIEKDDNKLTCTVEIDYKEMNLEKYVEDNPIMKSFTNENNKITVTGIKTIYESIGAICE